MNITFIGGGNMATALIGGLEGGGAHAREFRVVEPIPSQQDKLVGLFPGIGIFGEATAGAVDGADIAVLAVKPQQVREAVGGVLWVVREDMLDAVTGISGSGPAYVFYFLEGLEQAAQELGFTKADARTLAYATFAGTIKLANGSELEPAILRAQVTSKGGTTERAIALLEADAVKARFVAAVKAAAARAKELGDALSLDG